MDFLKRLGIYTAIILLCISIYKDITDGSFSNTKTFKETHESDESSTDMSVIKVKIQPGDTVLSITEEINHSLDNPVNIEQILADFKKYNPSTNPEDLQVNHYYYFLDYNDV